MYLCPTGQLQEQLQTFWDASKVQIGWNGAHNSFPHITLISPFKCSNSSVENLLRSLGKTCSDFHQDFSQQSLKLEKYQSPNFLGLFVGKKDEILLRSFAHELSHSFGAHDIVSEPNSKSYHITLAYQFQSQHFAGLEDLSSAINPNADCNWEVRVYSFEERFKSHEVHKVLYAHVPREDDELELMIGDLIYVAPEDVQSSTDGWVLGTSWLTGSQGYVPKNYIKQTAETSSWTLHLCIPMSNEEISNPVAPSDIDRMFAGSSSISSSNSSLERLREINPSLKLREASDGKSLAGDVTEKVDESKVEAIETSKSKTRQVYICRHGERVDFTFGTWVPFCFDENGQYTQRDLNMPLSVPVRSTGPNSFARDSPLTRFGTLQAKILGEGMKSAGVNISYAYSSPSLRCVETCHHILEGFGLQKQCKINIEPGLFEWLAWYQNAMPDWMTTEELIQAGYNIETKYKPYISAEELQDTQESTDQYYTRNFFVTQCILQATEEHGGNILLCGHAATLDVCTRQITGGSPRKMSDMMSIVRKIPYCSVAVLEGEIQDESNKMNWRIIQPPVPPLTHSNNSRYEWSIIASDSSS